MKLRVGFEMHYNFPQPTPMIMVLGTHFTRASDIIVPDHLTTLANVRSAQQRAADRSRPDRAGARCVRCSDNPDVRAEYAGQLQGLDRRGRMTNDCSPALSPDEFDSLREVSKGGSQREI